MNKPKLILIGGGGHCKSVIDVIEAENKFEIYGIIDKEEKIGSLISGYPIIAGDEQIEELNKLKHYFLITIGHIKNPSLRIKIFEKLMHINAKMATVVSPLAYVSKNASISDGTVIMHFAFVNSGVSIGSNCIINTRAIIEHDATIEQNCHVSTGAILNGECIVKKESFIGSNAVIIQGITIEKNNLVGAGAVITKNTEAFQKTIGNPGKSAS